MRTQSDFWLSNHGVWRIARKAHRCNGYTGRDTNGKLIRCQAIITPGTRYLDTNELTGNSYYHTMKLCGSCAAMPEDF